MSRHRNVRTMKYEDEIDDYDVYGHSVEDDYCVSPGTAAQFMYDRNQDQKLMSFIKEDIPEEEEPEEENSTTLGDSSNVPKPQLSDVDQAKLNSCLEEMRNILGETIPEHVMVDAVKKADFKYEVAINTILNTQEIPKQQREPRERHNRGKKNEYGDSKPDTTDASNQAAAKSTNTQDTGVTPEPSVARMTFSKKSAFTGFTIGEPDESSNGATAAVPSRTKSSYIDSNKSKIIGDTQPPSIVLESGSSSGHKNDEVDGAEGGSEVGQVIYSTPQKGCASDDERVGALASSATPVFLPIHKSASKVKLERLNMQHEYEKRKVDTKDNINLVVIGHVDAGKSTLMGHVLYQLGFVNKRTMHKYEQESKKLGKASFAYAWVLDETEEERSRGVTMDVAQTRFETKTKMVTLLDAPGHKDFIPNMITGAAQADAALLVVNASTGEFETGFEAGGQTREHAMLIRSLGVSQLTVAVNKMDTVEWDEQRFKSISHKLCQFLRQTGFRESDLVLIPCSGLLGENLTQPPSEARLTQWYKGPTVIDQIDQLRPPERSVDKPLRLCVTDVYKGMGSGFTVTGTMQAGSIQPLDRILVMPQGETAHVKNVTIDDLQVPYAFAGDNTAVTLLGIEMNNIGIGSILCDAIDPTRSTSRFKARVVIFNIEVPITKGFPCVLHYQSLTEPANFRKLISQLHKSSGEVVKKRPRCLVKNTNALVEIEVGRNICIEHYKDYKDLGRFMLRAGGTTIAAGLVTEIMDAKAAKFEG